ncbi:MAG TPA: polysaccharide biosynthesis/export family protein [Xanthobacteraceae bacterium]|nr:polysaccharide biosynthesis/export family protein [Xanthobacteraceae bacterium]
MLARTTLLAALALALASCAGRMPTDRIDPAFEAPYTLDAGDKLRVVVFGQDGLTNSYAVDSAGKITMPLIGGVEARGKTTSELSGAIVARLKGGYIREPHVAVEVESYRPFFILGEVTNSGQYAYVNGLTVESAVAVAGGFSPRALKTGASVARIVDGRTVHAFVPLSYPLRPGDTITVEERWL